MLNMKFLTKNIKVTDTKILICELSSLGSCIISFTNSKKHIHSQTVNMFIFFSFYSVK